MAGVIRAWVVALAAAVAAGPAMVTGPAVAETAASSATTAPNERHQRVIPLDGQRNMRDLGGYRTADGTMQVKWGKIYRSGSLSRLTDADYAKLAPLGIAAVIDLRSVSERAAEPTTWRAGPVEQVAKDYSSQSDAALAAVLLRPGTTPEAVKGAMAAFYRQMPDQFADQYSAIFHRLAAGREALLFHCTAGKDRTGVAAALILTVLGVDRDTVLADYALTNETLDPRTLAGGQNGPPEKDPYAFLRRLPPELITPLLRADPDYLAAALDQIDKDYGSVEAYVRTRLGISDKELAAIRERLLEPAAPGA